MLAMQVEIPFVPAAQRKPTETVEDAIVVVGQARQKKRKRAVKTTHEDPLSPRPSADAAGSDIHQAKNSGPDILEESFDFSGIPNILDDNPDLEDTKKPKKQKKHKHGKYSASMASLSCLNDDFGTVAGGTFYGDFPAPPKAHSELKAGNQSYTFK